MIGLLTMGACLSSFGPHRAQSTVLVMGEVVKRLEIDALKHGYASDQATFESLFRVRGVPRDAWGRTLLYEAPIPGGAPFDVVSLGEDGLPGGEGEARDLRWSELR